jgi:thiosulfate dehydrogenase (quinone) large subunit
MSQASAEPAPALTSPSGRRLPTPSAGWTGTIVRVLFGLVFGVDAVLKWLPGYRNTYLSALKSAAASQPAWLHGWFHFWITLQSKAPTSFAVLTGLAETGLALVLLLGVARRAGYALGVGYSLLVWSVGEGFGGPYASGSTDVGTGVVYALLFITLLTFAPPARRERLSLDRILVARWMSWRHLAEPHAVDRVVGAPIIEPVAVGTH